MCALGHEADFFLSNRVVSKRHDSHKFQIWLILGLQLSEADLVCFTKLLACVTFLDTVYLACAWQASAKVSMITLLGVIPHKTSTMNTRENMPVYLLQSVTRDAAAVMT